MGPVVKLLLLRVGRGPSSLPLPVARRPRSRRNARDLCLDIGSSRESAASMRVAHQSTTEKSPL
eukprot:scaffold173075_cov33-Tisochrysis_lutea.AAC.2